MRLFTLIIDDLSPLYFLIDSTSNTALHVVKCDTTEGLYTFFVVEGQRYGIYEVDFVADPHYTHLLQKALSEAAKEPVKKIAWWGHDFENRPALNAYLRDKNVH